MGPGPVLRCRRVWAQSHGRESDGAVGLVGGQWYRGPPAGAEEEEDDPLTKGKDRRSAAGGPVRGGRLRVRPALAGGGGPLRALEDVGNMLGDGSDVNADGWAVFILGQSAMIIIQIVMDGDEEWNS